MQFSSIGKIMALLFLLVVTGRIVLLRHGLPDTSDKNDSPATELFNNLVAQGLLPQRPEADFEIRLPEEDYVLAAQANGSNGPELKEQQKLLDALYGKVHGLRVQKQIGLWNLGQRMAAIRDDRPQADDSNGWKIIDVMTGHSLTSVAMLAAEFVYVGGAQLRPDFHNWRTSSNKNNNLMSFSTEFVTERPQTVHVQIIGDLDKVNLRKLLYDLKKNHQLLDSRIDDRTPEHACNGLPTIAYELTLKLPKSARIPMVIQLRNVKHNVAELDGLAIVLKENNPKPDEQQQQPECKGLLNPSEYSFAWNSRRLRSNTQNPLIAEKPFAIYTRDEVALTEDIAIPESNTPTEPSKPIAYGKPTDITLKNGLLALIGQDKQDMYALSGLINASVGVGEANTKVYLTIDRKIQELAQNRLQKDLKPDQTAALVFLDPNTGEILAAASHPIPPSNVHMWDRMAFSQVYPLKDPMQFAPWQGETGFNAPGSTFKVLTALAGFSAVNEGNPLLEKMMEGVKIDALKAITGLDSKSHSFIVSAKMLGGGQDKVINNFSVTKSIESYASKENTLGLHEAIKNSLNNWFIQLAYNMDYPYFDIEHPDKSDGTKSHLVKTALEQGFNGYYQLAPDSLHLSRYPAGSGARGDVLNAFGGRLVSNSSVPYIGPLLQNSMGQGMVTSPLQIARLAATVATGNNVRPRLLHKWDDKELKGYADPEPLKISDKQREMLRQAMKAVVADGTASNAFKASPLAKKVYGKTGTAQAQVKGRRTLSNTAWFMGWYEHSNNKPSLAFACQVTQAQGGGGAVCAPLVRDLLQALVEANLLEERHAK